MNPYLLQLKTAALMLFTPYGLQTILERETAQEPMTPYLQWMTIGTLVIFALYGLRCLLDRREISRPVRKWALLTAVIALALTVRLALELARVGFVVLTEMFDLSLEDLYWDDDVLLPLYTFSGAELSFFCGALGVCLSVLIANCITRRGEKAVTAGMDAFAPFGALMVVLFRLGQTYEPSLHLHGGGKPLPAGSSLAHFPFALEIDIAGGYSGWVWNICMLSALFALIWAVIAFVISLRGKGRTGLSFTLTLFFLCLPQIMCESMRGDDIKWLFVHVEQLFCALVLLGVLMYWIIGSKGVPALKRWLPLIILVVCLGLIVVTEFAIDGKWFDFSHTVCYIFMTFVLAAMGFAGVWAARNWNRSGEKPAETAAE